MPKKSAASTSNQTATEYFVTYFQMVYPDCRGKWNWSNQDIQKLQKSKPCFKSSCATASCHGKGKYCLWNRRKVPPPTFDWVWGEECWCKPFQCITVPCPEARYGLRRSVPVGLLTPDEREAFKKEANIKETDGYFLRTREQSEGLSIEDKVGHKRAEKEFKREVGGNVRKPKGFFVAGEYVEILCRCVQIADEIREAPNQSPVLAVNLVPAEPANAKRDARILELRQDDKSFSETCDIINDEFEDELIDEKTAAIALKRYCERNQIEYPRGKRGRKPMK